MPKPSQFPFFENYTFTSTFTPESDLFLPKRKPPQSTLLSFPNNNLVKPLESASMSKKKDKLPTIPEKENEEDLEINLKMDTTQLNRKPGPG